MGGVRVVDARLYDLANRYMELRVYALRLARMQLVISDQLGHIVALNDQYVWARLAYNSRRGVRRQLNVRCLRCGCVAAINDWIGLAESDDNHWAHRTRAANRRTDEPGYAFARECTGDKGALTVLNGLQQLLDTPVQPGDDELKQVPL